MKKLLLLALVMIGGVMQMSAWDNMYLLNSIDGNWTSNQTARAMTEVPDNGGALFYYILDSSEVTDENGYFNFSFYTTNDAGKRIGAYENNATIIGSTNYGCKDNESYNSFRITTDKKSKYIISLHYKYDNGNVWTANASVYTGNAKIRFVNTANYSNPYLYAYTDKDSKLLGNWPGTAMTSNGDGTWSIDVNANIGAYTNVIFVDYDGENVLSQYPVNNDGGINVTGNGVFDTTSKSKVESKNVSAGSGKATFSSAYPLDFSSTTNISAYTVSSLSKSSATLTLIDHAVPAQTGLIIIKKAGAAGNNDDIPTAVTTTSAGTNKLQPAVTATNVASDYAYILSEGEFHPAIAGTIPAGKAYLLKSDIPNEARSLSLVFDDEVAGVESVKAAEVQDNVFYNLAGQRIAAPTKGMYIVNGKKIIVK